MSNTVNVSKRLYTAALNFSNRVRKDLGLRPVSRIQDGNACESSSCPIARTIRHGWKRKGKVDVAGTMFTAAVTLPVNRYGLKVIKNYTYGTTVANFINVVDNAPYLTGNKDKNVKVAVR